MLEKYLELKAKDETRKAALKSAKEAIEVEFGDTESQLKAEREIIFQWMKDNKEERYVDGENGVIKIRPSKEKYVVVDEQKLIEFLMDGHYHEALEIKKSKVNLLKEQEAIPDELVKVVIEDELQISRNIDDE